MAQAITSIRHEQLSPLDEQELAIGRLLEAMSGNADAVDDALALLRQLHESGVLQLLRAMLEQGNEVLKIVVSLATQPGYVGGIKNVIALVQGLSNFDSRALAQGFRALANATDAFAADAELEPIGMFGIIEQLRDPDISTALSALFTFLKGFGQGLRRDDGAQAKDTDAGLEGRFDRSGRHLDGEGRSGGEDAKGAEFKQPEDGNPEIGHGSGGMLRH